MWWEQDGIEIGIGEWRPVERAYQEMEENREDGTEREAEEARWRKGREKTGKEADRVTYQLSKIGT